MGRQLRFLAVRRSLSAGCFRCTKSLNQTFVKLLSLHENPGRFTQPRTANLVRHRHNMRDHSEYWHNL
jgi:hypothetical protein